MTIAFANMKKKMVVHFLLAAMPVAVTFAQNSVPTESNFVRKVAAPPTNRNFSYPQSLFVDSQNGNIWVADFDNNRVMRFDVSTLMSIDDRESSIDPGRYLLNQNYPNPFNPKTTITFSMQNTEPATVKVYDLLGREIVTLFDGIANAGELYSLSLSAADLPSGVYCYRLRSATRTEVRRMTVLK